MGGKYSKAVGAAAGGVLAGAGLSVGVLPPDTPWYGHLIAMTITTVLPTVLTWWKAPNAG